MIRAIAALITVSSILAGAQSAPGVDAGRSVLGARLFRDDRFGAPKGDFATSCASCHFFRENAQGPRAGADFLSRSWIAYRTTDPKRHTLRNAQSIVDVADMPALHFDGEFDSLESLVAGTLTGRTMGWLAGEREAAVAHVRATAVARYRDEFRKAYGVDLAALDAAAVLDRVAVAVSDYMRSLRSRRDSPYDAFVANNGLDGTIDGLRSAFARKNALTRPDGFGSDALEGLEVFVTRGNCAACHPPPLFTDGTFHNIGISQAEYDAVHGEGRFASLAVPGPDAARPVAALREIPDARTPAAADLGFWNFVDTRRSSLRRKGESDEEFLARMVGTFKTPSLRNLALTSPYMHNGVYQNLPDALKAMVRLNALATQGRLRAADEAFTAMRLTDADVVPLVAFLTALNDRAPGPATQAEAAGARRSDVAAVDFKPHVIDAKVSGGYALLVHDINNDRRPDVIAVSLRSPELAWYENPGWERHVMVDGMNGLVNVAAHDVDGDGIPEVAVQSAFAMAAARSEGLVWLLRSQGDPRQRWKAERIDAFTTSHHIAWADVDGDGKKELINAPLIGPKSLAPTYDQDQAPLFWYRPGEWKREVITDRITGILHRVRPVRWDGDRRDALLTASFDGISLYWSSGSGPNLKWESRVLSPAHRGKAPRLGASDVAVGQIKGQRILASVEPWHGNEIVVYTEGRTDQWQRTVLFSELVEGHEVAVADFNGDGRDDIVAGDRGSRGATVHVLYAPEDPGGAWRHQAIDPGAMAASGCTTADVNGDKRIDIVCIGASTANLVWYENSAYK